MFQPLAIYKTFASGVLLVASFLYLPQGIFGAIVQVALRVARQRVAPGESRSETSVRAS
jgi:branched-chain amino acid transport system permease protein